MNTLGPHLRQALAVCYAVLILLPCILIALSNLIPKPLFLWTFLGYAFALLPAYYVDHWFLGGLGYHQSLVPFILLATFVATMLWPLPLLSRAPSVWQSANWRRIIIGYSAVWLAFAILAGRQMTKSWALFFG